MPSQCRNEQVVAGKRASVFRRVVCGRWLPVWEREARSPAQCLEKHRCRKPFSQNVWLAPFARGFYGVLSSLRQRIRSREHAQGQDGHPRVWSRHNLSGIECHFGNRAFQTPIDSQAIFTILPANLVRPRALVRGRAVYAATG